jgi:hypothetical protein
MCVISSLQISPLRVSTVAPASALFIDTSLEAFALAVDLLLGHLDTVIKAIKRKEDWSIELQRDGIFSSLSDVTELQEDVLKLWDNKTRMKISPKHVDQLKDLLRYRFSLIGIKPLQKIVSSGVKILKKRDYKYTKNLEDLRKVPLWWPEQIKYGPMKDIGKHGKTVICPHCSHL